MNLLAWGPARAALTLGITQTIAYAASLYLPAVLAAPMAAEFGVSRTNVFAAFSAALFLQALLGRLLGHVVDRHGGRALLVGASLIFCLGLGGLALSATLIQFYLAWLVVGCGMALGLYDIAFASLVGWFGTAARRPITGVTLIAGFASTIGWPLTSWFEASFGWRDACLVWAAAHLLITLPLHLSLRRGGEHTRVVAAHAALPPGARRTMALLAVAFAALALYSTAVQSALPALLVALGVLPVAALAASTLAGPSQVAARVAEALLLHRLHPLQSARLALALLFAGAVGLLASGGVFAAPFAILYGCGAGLFTIARGNLPLALFGAGGYGARLGLLSIPAQVGYAAAPFAFSLLSTESPRTATAALVVCALIGLVALAFVRLRPS